MVQKFNVLRCFSCQRFQVHQVKKAKKWICKVCGEKQSTSKIYGQGSAPDCRRHVQKLNTIQGEREQLIAEKVIDDDFEEFDCEVEVADTEQFGQENFSIERDQAGSKWERFIETEKKNEESLEEEFLNGIPVTMDKKTFDDETKKGKQAKNWNKNTQRNDELLPQNKRMKTQNHENDEDDFKQRHYSERKNFQKVNEMNKKSKSKWEIFKTTPEEIPDEDEGVPFKKHEGTTSKSKSFDTIKPDDSSVKHTPCNSQNLTSKNSNSQAKNKGMLCTLNTNTSHSKWSKFLGSSTCANEEDKVEEENDELLYSRFGVSENSQEDRNLVIPGKPIGSKSLGSICNVSNYQCVESNEARNSSGLSIPPFLLNARATRSEQKASKSTNSCQSNQESSASISSKDLFTIDDELGDEWWNV